MTTSGSHIKNLNLTIAGPGAGKTHQMVEDVIKNIPNLKPHKYLAVVTYTNAATDEIKNRLEQKIRLPENVFIGTIHSFLIKFIFEPFSNTVDSLPTKKTYVDKAYVPEFYENGFRLSSEKKQEIGKANAIKLFQKGLVVYDKILEKALDIIKIPQIADLVSNRLQFVFIDEYQDSRLFQHEAFMEIYKKGNTQLFFIGDPLQSIYNFTYNTSQAENEIGPKGFNEIPINKLITSVKDNATIRTTNHRSESSIIDFINTFQIQKFKQELPSGKIKSTSSEIYFINQQDKIEILKTFFKLIDNLNIGIEFKGDKEIMHSLILSRNNDTLSSISDEFRLNRISNENNDKSGRIKEFHRCFLGILGISENKLIYDFGLSKINQRKTTIQTIEFLQKLILDKDTAIETLIQKGGTDSQVQGKIIEFWNGKHDLHFHINNDILPDFRNTLLRLLFEVEIKNQSKRFYSTIHSAKGLEASCVLVLAEERPDYCMRLGKWYRNPTIDYWLESNKELDNDEVRIGYVAFSRARKLLCIASMEALSSDLVSKLKTLGVNFIP